MKTKLIAILSSCLAVLFCLLGEARAILFTTELRKDIENATLYGSGQAEINRFVTLYTTESVILEGHHEVLVKGLQKSMDDQSLHLTIASSTESGSFAILDFKVSTEHLPRSESVEYKAIRADLQSKQNELSLVWADHNMTISRIENKIKVLNAYLDVKLTSAGSISVGSSSALSPAEAIMVIESSDQEISKFQGQLLELKKKSKYFEAQNEILIQQYKDLTSGIEHYETEKELRVHINVLKPITVNKFDVFNEGGNEFARLYLRYIVSPASWYPLYELHIKSPNDETTDASCKFDMDLYAKVSQQTGEDWYNVQLMLSTASPQYISSLPIPKTKSVYSQLPIKHYGAPKMMMKSRSRSFDSINAQMIEGGAVGFATESDVGLASFSSSERTPVELSAISTSADLQSSGNLQMSTSYQILHRVNVTNTESKSYFRHRNHHHDSAGYGIYNEHKLLIDKFTLYGNLYTFAVPSVDAESYLVGFTHLPSTSKTPLLSSSYMRLDIDNDHIGTSSFPGLHPGDRIKLNFGVNHNVQISSNEIVPSHLNKEEDKSTWFVTDKRKYRIRTYERLFTIKSSYTVSNADNHKEKVLVILSENLPKSTEEGEFKIEMVTPTFKDLIVLSGDGNRDIDTVNNDEFLNRILESELAGGLGKREVHHYQCKSSGNIFWVFWMKSKETKSFSFKYKLISPDEKEPIID